MEMKTEEVVAAVSTHPADHSLGLDEVPEQSVASDNADVERDARRQGWVPREQFRGSDDEWIDANTFVQRGREINPILRANNDRLKSQIDSLYAQNNVLVRELTDLKKGHATIQQRDYNTTLRMLKEARLEAMENNDNSKFLELDERIDQLREQKDQYVPQVQEPSQPQAQADPEFMGWLQDNRWYGSDEWRTSTINKVAEEMRATYPHLVGRKFLDEVLEEAVSRYPRDFGAAPRQSTMNHQMVEDGGRRSSLPSRGGRRGSMADLPSDAREAMKRFVRDGIMTEQRYIDLYFAGEQA